MPDCLLTRHEVGNSPNVPPPSCEIPAMVSSPCDVSTGGMQGFRCCKSQYSEWMFESPLASGLLGALLTAIVAVFVVVVRMKRDDSIRSDEQERAEKLRKEDREFSVVLRRDDLDRGERMLLQEREVAATIRAEEREHQFEMQIRTDGVTEAKFLLNLLAELQADFGGQEPSEHGTYQYNSDLTGRITAQLRLVPDKDVQELVRLNLGVINHTWVVESVGDLPSSGQQAQREALDVTMDVVGSWIIGGEWDRINLDGARSVTSTIDDAFKEYFDERS